MPFTAKLILPLYAGILNLSAGVKDMLVCACVLGQVKERIKIMKIMAIPVETLPLFIFTKPHAMLYYAIIKFG